MSKLPKPISDSPGWSTCSKFGDYQIFIEEDDKIQIPHFHVVDTKTYGEKFHCRILINKPHYYKGETSKLSKENIKLMCQVLDSNIKHSFIDQPVTGWQISLIVGSIIIQKH